MGQENRAVWLVAAVVAVLAVVITVSLMDSPEVGPPVTADRALDPDDSGAAADGAGEEPGTDDEPAWLDGDAAASSTSTSSTADPATALGTALDDTGRGPVERHAVVMTITTDDLVRWSYRWRGRDASDIRLADASRTVSRTFVTSLPTGAIVAQLGPDGGRVSCSVKVDGVVTASYDAEGAYAVAFCQG